MEIDNRVLVRAIISVTLGLLSLGVFGQTRLEKSIQQHADSIDGKVGVYAMVLESDESVSYNANQKFPMQSVYKFPIAMAVLDKVDRGELTLERTVQVAPSDFIPQQGYSPIRDKFPGGVTLTVKELLKYSILSDGSASDVLLKIIGGVDAAQDYVRRLGITDIAITLPEKIQVANDTIQYQNWATPKAMTQLLNIFYTGDALSDESQSLLLHDMIDSKTGTHRLKGLLPEGTTVAHKTGTAGTYNGLTRATNDVGIISLPTGKHLAVSVFISDSHASPKERDRVIASIAKALYDHWND